MPYFGKSAKNFFLVEKNPTSSSKIGSILGKKMFRKSFETSLIISSEIIKFDRKIVFRKTFLSENITIPVQKNPHLLSVSTFNFHFEFSHIIMEYNWDHDKPDDKSELT